MPTAVANPAILPGDPLFDFYPVPESDERFSGRARIESELLILYTDFFKFI